MTSLVLGEFKRELMGHDLDYYQDRECFLDCRGNIRIDEDSMFGFGIKLITLSHDISNYSSPVKYRPVVINKRTFIGSFSILYNCNVGEGSIVSIGTVLRSRDVPEYTIVEGNPAVVIAKFNHYINRWEYLKNPQELQRKK